MTAPIHTLERFRRTGKNHLASAEVLLDPASATLPTTTGTAAYLAHVALECVLKAHLLFRNGCASKEDLEAKHPSVHAALFVGSQGHDLQKIADDLRLPILVAQQGKSWKADPCWTRMASRARPYSLRYGAEEVSTPDVRKELGRAREILTAVLAQTGTVPLASKRRRGKR